MADATNAAESILRVLAAKAESRLNNGKRWDANASKEVAVALAKADSFKSSAKHFAKALTAWTTSPRTRLEATKLPTRY